MSGYKETYKLAHRTYVKDKDIVKALKLFEEVIRLCPDGHEFKNYALIYKHNIEIELKADNSHAYSKKNEEFKEEQQKNEQLSKDDKSKERIISCPSCEQKIKIILPLPRRMARCIKCQTRFKISIDNHGHIYITRAHENESKPDSNESVSKLRNIEDCFNIFEVAPGANSSQIKAAYRIKMMEYHPDKVTKLGMRLRNVAEEETKKLNYAYTMLKEKGFL